MSKNESKKKKNTQTDDVVLIDDPFLMNTFDVAQAQRISDEELELDLELEEEIPELNPEDLDKLEKAIQNIQTDTEEQAADSEAANYNPEKELAEQIAEDQALQEKENQVLEDADEVQATSLDTEAAQAALEAILFISDRPLSEKKLHETLGENTDKTIFKEAITNLMNRYQNPLHGIELVEISGGYQFRTKPSQAQALKKITKIQFQKLSRGAMETLAVVAYKQPVMKEEVDTVRGVDCSYFIRGLLERNLIQISGRSDLPGRPILYSTTDHFLQIFGLNHLSALPSLSEIEQMIPTSEAGKNAMEEDPQVRKMRNLVSMMNLDHSGALGYNAKEDEVLLKDIRERVGAIEITTPFLTAQKEAEKQQNQQPESEKTTLL